MISAKHLGMLIPAMTIAALLAACGGGTAAPSSTPTAAVTMTATSAATEIVTPVASATATVAGSTATATATPYAARLQANIQSMAGQMRQMQGYWQQANSSQQQKINGLMATMINQMGQLMTASQPALGMMSSTQRQAVNPQVQQMQQIMQGMMQTVGQTPVAAVDPSDPNVFRGMGGQMFAMHQQFRGMGGMMGQQSRTPQMMSYMADLYDQMAQVMGQIGPAADGLNADEQETLNQAIEQMQDTMRQMYGVVGAPIPSPTDQF